MKTKRKPRKKPLAPLTVPDTKRCQAEERPGGPYSFMTLGPIPPLARCNERPAVIAKEQKPGKDGRRGSMSLCAKHAAVLINEYGPGFATFTTLPGGRN